MRISGIAVLVVLASMLAGCAAGRSASAEAVLRQPSSGFVAVDGGRVWYEVHGRGMRTPLLVLHGGPGIPHDYLDNLAELGDERPVVFYDQLGCGKSDRPDDTALWTRPRFAREVAQVRAALGLQEVVLYGHSWGSILAVDYLTGVGGEKPAGVQGVILAGPALSIPRWVADGRGLIAALGPETARVIDDAERSGKTDTPAYKDAVQLFYSRYVCRVDPWPDGLQRALAGMGPVNQYMCGASEFTITGTLKTVDVTPALGRLTLPSLFICGEFDEATPDTTRDYAGLAPQSRVVVIAGASHCANYDQPAAYFAALREWLGKVEKR